MDKFTPEMDKIINNIPAMLERLRGQIAGEILREIKLQLYPGHGFITGRLRGDTGTPDGMKIRKRGNTTVIGATVHYAARVDKLYNFMEMGTNIASQQFDSIANATVSDFLERL